MGRQLVLIATLSLVLLAVAFTPGCQGRTFVEDEQMLDTENEAVAEHEQENEEEWDDVEKLELLARLFTDQMKTISEKHSTVCNSCWIKI